MDEFSKRLKDLMEMEGLSNRALSMKINVDRASIRLWLSGRFYPRYDALIRTVPHTHGNGVLQSGQAATCMVNGWKDYYKCSCGKI